MRQVVFIAPNIFVSLLHWTQPADANQQSGDGLFTILLFIFNFR